MFGGLGKAGWATILVTGGLMLGTSISAQAADLGGDCCADLEERVADLEATTARKGNRKVKLEVSGTVNEALMWWDDGQESNIYQGTNDTARSRFRFKGEAKITSDWKAGYLIELGLRTNRLNRTDQDLSNASPGGPDIRHSVWYLESKTYGRGSVGMTSQATDGATEATTANMNHFARPSLSKWNGNFDVIVNGVRCWISTAPSGAISWRRAVSPATTSRAKAIAGTLSATTRLSLLASSPLRPGAKMTSGMSA